MHIYLNTSVWYFIAAGWLKERKEKIKAHLIDDVSSITARFSRVCSWFSCYHLQHDEAEAVYIHSGGYLSTILIFWRSDRAASKKQIYPY